MDNTNKTGMGESENQQNLEEEFKSIVKEQMVLYERATEWETSDIITGTIKDVFCRVLRDDKRIILGVNVDGTNQDMFFVLNKTNLKSAMDKLEKKGCARWEFLKLIGEKVKVSIVQVMFRGKYVNTFKFDFL